MVILTPPAEEAITGLEALTPDGKFGQQGAGDGPVGVRNADGSYAVSSVERYRGAGGVYDEFVGTRDEAAAFITRDHAQRVLSAEQSARHEADQAIGRFDNKGRVTLNVGLVPNEWAVEQGYAEWAESVGKSYGSYQRPTVRTIRWKPGTDPERVLFHFEGGHPAPENFAAGTQGFDQFEYGRGKLRGKNKAERERIMRRVTAALVAHGFRFDQPTLVAAGLGDVVAAAGPVAPPASWFEDPQLDGPTPLTITAEGRIFGHVADWNTCHIGEPRGPGVCVLPPRSATGYALFHLGSVLTADGKDIAVGTLTLDAPHAGIQLNAHGASRHYDHTGTAVADVRAGEDRHGPWVAGAVRPNVSDTQLRALRAAKISGDWRRGELVAALLVNVPGFPIPRPEARMVASAYGEQQMALVAAGIVLEDCGCEDLSDAVVERRVRVLAARSEGIEALVALAEGDVQAAGKKKRYPLRVC